jgi:hypothetical protein
MNGCINRVVLEGWVRRSTRDGAVGIMPRGLLDMDRDRDRDIDIGIGIYGYGVWIGWELCAGMSDMKLNVMKRNGTKRNVMGCDGMIGL